MEKITISELKTILNSHNTRFKECIFGENLKETIEVGSLDISKYINERNKPIELSFDECVFEIPIRFSGLNIKYKYPLLKDCIFNKNVHFGQVYFENLEIEKSIFNKECSFYTCQFEERLSFSETTFNGRFRFETGKVPKVTEITKAFFNCDFNGHVQFKDIIFGKIEFMGSTIGDKSFIFHSCIFKDLALLRKMNLNSNVEFLNTDITNCSFLNSEFEKVFFSSSNVDINNHIDIKFLHDKMNKNYDRFKELAIFNIQELVNEVSPVNLIIQLKTFEKNYDNKKQFELAGEFHKKSLDIDKEYNAKGFKLCILSLYKFFSDYGENYLKVGQWFVYTIVFFTFVYLLSGLDFVNENTHTIIFYFKTSNINCFINDIGLSFLYSVINSFPVKRDIDIIKAANGFTVFWSSVQTIIQSVFITLFIIALRRKFKR